MYWRECCFPAHQYQTKDKLNKISANQLKLKPVTKKIRLFTHGHTAIVLLLEIVTERSVRINRLHIGMYLAIVLSRKIAIYRASISLAFNPHLYIDWVSQSLNSEHIHRQLQLCTVSKMSQIKQLTKIK